MSCNKHDINNHVTSMGFDHRCAHECDDQLPNIAHVGRGIPGNSFYVECYDDEKDQNLTVLIGKQFDAVTKDWTEVWRSDNINGGRLQLYYHLNPNDSPRSFIMTFVYSRPSKYTDKTGMHECEHKRDVWAFTTPAIPYLYTTDPMLGSVVGTLFLRDHKVTSAKEYKDMLTYPKVAGGTQREMFNAPFPPGGDDKISNKDELRTGDSTLDTSDFEEGSEWNVYLDLLELEEFEKVSGLNEATIIGIINGVKNIITPNLDGRSDYFKTDFKNVKSDNIKDFIEDMIQAENTARHKADEAIWDEINKNIKPQINNLGDEIKNINKRLDKIDKTLGDIIKKFYGGGKINDDGTITWPNSDLAAVGNINVYGVDKSVGWLMTHGKTANDDKRGDIYAR